MAKKTDDQFVLEILTDGKVHSGKEIEMISLAKRGHGLTLHSRISALRDKGWIIGSKRNGRRDFNYWLEGKREARKKVVPEPIVKAYLFRSDADVPQNERICEILRRAEPDGETLEPAFIVKFSNGEEMTAWGAELRPWYPS